MNINKLIAFVAVFFLAAPAFAGESIVAVMPWPPVVEDRANLEFGTILRPLSGSGNVVMTCGNNGLAAVTVPIYAINVDTADDQCGEVGIMPGDPNQKIIITFGATGNDSVFTLDGNILATRFTLYDDSGSPVPGLANYDPTAGSPASSSVITIPATRSYYIGASVAISSVTAAGDYSAIYEITVAEAE